MHRRCVVAVSLLTLTACHAPALEPAPQSFGSQNFGAVFVDTDGDGLPDTRLPAGRAPARGQSAFVDTNGDGLPDAPLPAANAPRNQR